MKINLALSLSERQAWVLAAFLTEVTFDDILKTTDEALTLEQRRVQAEDTLRVLRLLADSLVFSS